MKRLYCLVLLFILASLLLIGFNLSQKSYAELKPNSNQFENEEEALAEKQEIIDNNLTQMISYLGSVEAVIKVFNKWEAAEQTTALNEIATYKDWLEEKKIQAQNETSFEEIKLLEEEVVDYWDNVYVRTIYWNGQLMQAKLEYIYGQFNELITALNPEIIKAGEEGDLAGQSLNLTKDKLSLLAAKKTQSNEKFAGINNKEMALITFTQGKQFVIEAKSICIELKTELENTIYYLEN